MAWPENVDRSQLRIDFYRGSGAGGQKRNKTSNACRITHLPTRFVAQCENHRSQGANRTEAFKRLAKVLVPIMLNVACKLQGVEKSSDLVIRTYHEPRHQVKDRRTGKIYNYEDVLNGSGLERIHDDMEMK